MQTLASDKWFNNNLINIISDLMKADFQTFLLSSFLYRKLKKEDFNEMMAAKEEFSF